jgi:hypothetical protein
MEYFAVVIETLEQENEKQEEIKMRQKDKDCSYDRLDSVHYYLL